MFEICFPKGKRMDAAAISIPPGHRCNYFAHKRLSPSATISSSVRVSQNPSIIQGFSKAKRVTTKLQSRSLVVACASKKPHNKDYGSLTELKLFAKETAVFLLTTSAVVLCNLGLSGLPLAHAALPMPYNFTSESNKNTKTKYSDQEVEDMAADYLKKKPNDVTAQKIVLRKKLREQDLEGALKILQKLCVIEPSEVMWKVLMGDCFVFMEDYASARKVYHRVLKFSPYHPDATFGLVTVMEKCNELPKILPLLEGSVKRALRDKETDSARSLRLLLGKYYLIANRFEDALKNYQYMAEKDPQDFVPYFWQGIIYDFYLHKKDEAEKQYEKCRQFVGEDFPNKEDLAELFSDMRDQYKELTIPQETKKVPQADTLKSFDGSDRETGDIKGSQDRDLNKQEGEINKVLANGELNSQTSEQKWDDLEAFPDKDKKEDPVDMKGDDSQLSEKESVENVAANDTSQANNISGKRYEDSASASIKSN